jgi:hypothetical protein
MHGVVVSTARMHPSLPVSSSSCPSQQPSWRTVRIPLKYIVPIAIDTQSVSAAALIRRRHMTRRQELLMAQFAAGNIDGLDGTWPSWWGRPQVEVEPPQFVEVLIATNEKGKAVEEIPMLAAATVSTCNSSCIKKPQSKLFIQPVSATFVRNPALRSSASTNKPHEAAQPERHSRLRMWLTFTSPTSPLPSLQPPPPPVQPEAPIEQVQVGFLLAMPRAPGHSRAAETNNLEGLVMGFTRTPWELREEGAIS